MTLIEFYTKMGRKEFKNITENNEPGTLTPDHFVHFQFCNGVVHSLMMAKLEWRFEHGDQIQKFEAGLRLYQDRVIEQRNGSLN